jgi:hypothetical protein
LIELMHYSTYIKKNFNLVFMNVKSDNIILPNDISVE